MNRRRFLATSFALLPGCSTNTDNTATPKTNTSTTSTAPTTTQTTRAVSRLAEPTTTKTDQEVTATINGLDCQQLPPTPDTCPHTAGKLELSLSHQTTPLTNGELAITLTNTTESTFTWNPYDWTVYTRGQDRWRTLAPVMIPGSLDELPPGESHTYTITSTNAELLGINSYRSETRIKLYGLGPGPFGLTTTGHFESTPETDYTAGAIFGFYGDEPPTKPTTHVKATEFKDDILTVTTNAASDTYLQVEFVGGTPDHSILDNHIRQTRVLRNTLSYAPTDGITTIQYYDSPQVIENALDYLTVVTSSDTERFGFRDYTYTLTTNNDT